MGVVVFSYPGWVQRFPEFATVSEPLAQDYFLDATDILRNDACCSSVTDDARKLRLLNLLVAHIAALNAVIAGKPSPGLVGRISNASEGSVSVQTEFETMGAQAWYAQTKYGAQFWEATRGLRTMHYRPGWSRFMGPWGWGRRGWTDGWDGSTGY